MLCKSVVADFAHPIKCFSSLLQSLQCRNGEEGMVGKVPHADKQLQLNGQQTIFKSVKTKTFQTFPSFTIGYKKQQRQLNRCGTKMVKKINITVSYTITLSHFK